MKLATFSLCALASGSDAYGVWAPNRPRGWSWHSTHELSRGTADMPEAYDPNYAPEPKRQATILDTSGACSMNPWVFLAIVDQYGDAAKFSMFGSRDAAGNLVKSGQTSDALFASLTECADNKGIKKIMAIDAMAKQRPDVVESILDTNTDSTGSQHQKIKDILFENPLEFYQNFWKYNEFINVFENSGFSKWAKINSLMKIVGDQESPAARYRDRTFLMKNLKTEPFTWGTRQSSYMPVFNRGERKVWNRHNFMAGQWNSPWYKPQQASQQVGAESQRYVPLQGAKLMPDLEAAEYQQAQAELAIEEAAAIQEAAEAEIVA